MKKQHAARRTKTAPIKTTFLELINELSKLTDDDNLVVAAVKNIFRSHKITATRSLAPIKLVATARRGRGRLGARGAYWA